MVGFCPPEPPEPRTPASKLHLVGWSKLSHPGRSNYLQRSTRESPAESIGFGCWGGESWGKGSRNEAGCMWEKYEDWVLI